MVTPASILNLVLFCSVIKILIRNLLGSGLLSMECAASLRQKAIVYSQMSLQWLVPIEVEIEGLEKGKFHHPPWWCKVQNSVI